MRYYTKTEEWVLIKDGVAYVGLSEFAANELGDIVFVDLPRVGERFQKDESFGAVESVKAASDLYMPITGEIYEVNELLEDNPELLNEDPLKNYLVVLTNFKEEELKDLILK
ncbi:MAG: glycine cleavage system protein GcvH [Acholeplasmataceae bacterium]|jgi:glycine cleavage system H protein